MVTREDGPKAVDVHVGQRMRSLRRERGMSQTALAQAIGLTFQQIQKYERGFNRVSASTLYDISRVFSVTPGSMFEGLAGVGEPVPNAAAQARITFAVSVEGARLYEKLVRLADDKRRMGVVEGVLDMALGFDAPNGPPPGSDAEPDALRSALSGLGKPPEPNTPAGLRASLAAIPKVPLAIRKPAPRAPETPLRAAIDALHHRLAA